MKKVCREMNNNLLIVGAGIYGLVAQEIAVEMGCFGKINFVDDEKEYAPNGVEVIGTTGEIRKFANQYHYIVVAIGNPHIRRAMLEKIEATSYQIVSLISPRSYISPSAKVMSGCIIEPMAVVQSKCYIAKGCIISAGAVINHECICEECTHIDVNATVSAGAKVLLGTKVKGGSLYV